MSNHETGPQQDTDDSDSTVDVIAAVSLILIAVVTMIYWVSGL